MRGRSRSPLPPYGAGPPYYDGPPQRGRYARSRSPRGDYRRSPPPRKRSPSPPLRGSYRGPPEGRDMRLEYDDYRSPMPGRGYYDNRPPYPYPPPFDRRYPGHRGDFDRRSPSPPPSHYSRTPYKPPLTVPESAAAREARESREEREREAATSKQIDTSVQQSSSSSRPRSPLRDSTTDNKDMSQSKDKEAVLSQSSTEISSHQTRTYSSRDPAIPPPRACKFGRDCYHPQCIYGHPPDRDLEGNMARQQDRFRPRYPPPRSAYDYPPHDRDYRDFDRDRDLAERDRFRGGPPPRDGPYGPRDGYRDGPRGPYPSDRDPRRSDSRYEDGPYGDRSYPPHSNPLADRAAFVPSMDNSEPRKASGTYASVQPKRSIGDDSDHRRLRAEEDDLSRKRYSADRRRVRGPVRESIMPALDEALKSLRQQRLANFKSSLDSAFTVHKELRDLERSKLEVKAISDYRHAMDDILMERYPASMGLAL